MDTIPMAVSKPIRIPENLIEKAEETALTVSAKDKKQYSINDVLRRAMDIGLDELKKGKKKM